MKIECVIRRPKGTKVELQGIEYYFKPSEGDQRHIADIENQVHIRQLLRIPEGYKALEDLPAQVQGQIDDSLRLVGSKIHSAVYDIRGETITIDELVAMAFEDSGLDRDAWNGLVDESRYEYIDNTLVSLQGADQASQDDSGNDGGETPPVNGDGEEQADQNKPESSEKPADLEQTHPTPELDRDALVAAYKEKFGKAPHHKLSAERISQVLEEA